MNNRPALCTMELLAERLSRVLHALDSYQKSMPVNRAYTVWKYCLWHVNSGRTAVMLHANWRLEEVRLMD